MSPKRRSSIMGRSVRSGFHVLSTDPSFHTASARSGHCGTSNQSLTWLNAKLTPRDGNGTYFMPEKCMTLTIVGRSDLLCVLGTRERNV